MKVLVACEFSGIVRDAFREKGHDAMSCDLVPSEKPGAHFQGDVMDIINDDWDLMIAHPPCTYLSTVGNRHLGQPGRDIKRRAAAVFFMALWDCKIPKICIENPVGYMSSIFRPADQIIQPYQFGHPVQKRTCLWLKNLPPLKPTIVLPKPEPEYLCQGKKTIGKKIYFVEAAKGDGLQREQYRSRSFQGIADAMADQWG